MQWCGLAFRHLALLWPQPMLAAATGLPQCQLQAACSRCLRKHTRVPRIKTKQRHAIGACLTAIGIASRIPRAKRHCTQSGDIGSTTA